jgi:LPXTG-motif cell wall-anchored protein
LPPIAATVGSKSAPPPHPTATVSSETGSIHGSLPGLPNTGQPDNITTWLIILMLISASLGYWLRRQSNTSSPRR